MVLKRVSFLLLGVLIPYIVSSQLLEPRLVTNVPIKTNFLLAGYSYTTGDMLLDPALPVEDLNGKVHAAFAGYVRSLRIGKQSAKIVLAIPYASGAWKGVVDGIDSTRNQNGIGDIAVSLGYNFAGSPALTVSEFPDYQQDLVAGFSAQVYFPTGAYDNDRVINIGSNRFRFRGILGASKIFGKWITELYGAFWLFAKNNDFLQGGTLVQRPLAALKVHVIRTLPRGNWITLDGGYAFGGTTIINEVPRDTRISTFRFGITIAIPFLKRHNLRLIGYSGRRLEKGPDFDGFSTVYQYRWYD